MNIYSENRTAFTVFNYFKDLLAKKSYKYVGNNRLLTRIKYSSPNITMKKGVYTVITTTKSMPLGKIITFKNVKIRIISLLEHKTQYFNKTPKTVNTYTVKLTKTK